AWTAEYQQRPVPDEGNIFLRQWWRYQSGDRPQFHEVIQSWDMAFKETDSSSYVVGQVWGRDLADKHLLAQIRKRMTFTETLKAVEHLTDWVEAESPQPGSHAKLAVEKANGAAVIAALRR